MILCTIDGTGLYTGFFDDSFHTNIPGDAIEIPDVIWEAHTSGSQLSYWNGTAHANLPVQPSVYHDWDGDAWIDSTTRQWDDIRIQRDSLLVKSDPEVAIDRWNAMDVPTQTAWTTYRQELRDIPQTYSADPNSVVWPTPPA